MFCKVQAIGNLGADPKPIKTQSEIPMTVFSLATEDYYLDAEGARQRRPLWHQVVCFDTHATLASTTLKKGMLVYVEGRLRYNESNDEEGKPRRVAEIVAGDLRVLRSPGGSPAKPPEPSKSTRGG